MDECAAGTAVCPAQSYCVNKAEGYMCNCSSGYKMVDDKCVDINECTQGTDDCNPDYGLCVNLVGGYRLVQLIP